MVWKTLHFITAKVGYYMGFLLGLGFNRALLVLEAQVRGGSHQSEPSSHMSLWGQGVGGMGRKMSGRWLGCHVHMWIMNGNTGEPLLPCSPFYFSHIGLPP